MASFDLASVRKPDQGGFRWPIRALVKDREDLADGTPLAVNRG
jgi:hypothetical protein